MPRTAEHHQRLWPMAASPVIWAVHFLACYVTAAVWCAKAADPTAPLGPVRGAVAAYTVCALAALGIAGWHGLRSQRHGGSPPPHDADSPEDRHRFIGLATLLLAGLSAVAVLYAALVPVFVETCQ